MPVDVEARELIQKEAIASGVANLLINAVLNGWLLAGKGPHALTVDSIASKDPTVFSSAVPMAVILAMVGTAITFFVFRKKAVEKGFAGTEVLVRPFLFFGLKHALGAAFVVFGAVVAAGVVWQRLAGTVTVSTPVAALLCGLVAGFTSWYVSSRTSWALLRER